MPRGDRKPCANGCFHTTAEHHAFDRGHKAGRLRNPEDANPYGYWHLREIWEYGREFGLGDSQLKEEK